MFQAIRQFRRRRDKPFVRPWALATPIAVLLFCLPLLRPLRHPGQLSVDEELRLATIAAIVEHKPSPDPSLAARLAIDGDNFAPQSHLIMVSHRLYSDQPPVMAFLLSGPYWILHRLGYTLRGDSVLVPYLLTLLGVTLPVAAAAGLAYRMGRMFELTRPWRTGLSAAMVFGSGLISYAVVLNAHVPAATLVLAAMGCLVHLFASKNPGRRGGWLVVAGFCASLAAVTDPWAAVFLVLLIIAIAAMRLPVSMRLGGILLYLLGTTPPLVLHAVLTVHITGNMLPGSFHPELAAQSPRHIAELQDDSTTDDSQLAPDSQAADEAVDAADAATAPGPMQRAWSALMRFAGGLVGPHGLLVHFPVVILGIAGMLAVMHRHWPATTKILASISAASMLIGLIGFAVAGSSGSAAYPSPASGFANRWLIVFAPVLFFWTGAWLRRSHRPGVWWFAGVLLGFSVLVSLIGATDPMPRLGYNRYTVAAALHNLFHPPQTVSSTASLDR